MSRRSGILAINTQNQSVQAADSRHVHVSRQMGGRLACDSSRLPDDFLFAGSGRGPSGDQIEGCDSHLWVASPHSMCPLSHLAPVLPWLQRLGSHKLQPSGGLPPVEASGVGGPSPLPFISLCFLPGHLALLIVISFLFFFEGSSQLVHACADVHRHLHTCVCTQPPSLACPGHCPANSRCLDSPGLLSQVGARGLGGEGRPGGFQFPIQAQRPPPASL